MLTVAFTGYDIKLLAYYLSLQCHTNENCWIFDFSNSEFNSQNASSIFEINVKFQNSATLVLRVSISGTESRAIVLYSLELHIIFSLHVTSIPIFFCIQTYNDISDFSLLKRTPSFLPFPLFNESFNNNSTFFSILNFYLCHRFVEYSYHALSLFTNYHSIHPTNGKFYLQYFPCASISNDILIIPRVGTRS